MQPQVVKIATSEDGFNVTPDKSIHNGNRGRKTGEVNLTEKCLEFAILHRTTPNQLTPEEEKYIINEGYRMSKKIAFE